MRFSKNPTQYDEQVSLLRDRGMVIGDEDLLGRWLKTVGYYRLSAYWLFYELAPEDGKTRSKRFANGTSFEDVIALYTFDRKLRLLLMEALERIEIAIRTSWTYHFAHAHGPHAFMDAANFNSGWDHARQIVLLSNRIEKSAEQFIEHYRGKYDDPYLPPIWAITETFSFTELSKWLSMTGNRTVRAKVAHDLGLPSKEILESSLEALSLMRNVAAHHGRLWNRRFVKRLPNIKRFRDDLVVHENGDQRQTDNLIYNIMVLLIRLMRHQAADTSFPSRLRQLVGEVDDGKRGAMGFPADWRARPAWQES